MNKIFATVVAVAMLAMASPAITTQASETPVANEALDTFVYAERPTDHPGNEGNKYCTSDDSKIVTSVIPVRQNAYCTSGAHDPAFYSITHGPDLPTMSASGFTGVVESIVFYDGGERRWACSFSSGSFTGCQGSGSWPGRAVEFCHDVWAYDATGVTSQPLFTGFVTGCPNGDMESVADLNLGSNSQPSGDGIPSAAWAAYVVHA